MTNNGVSSAPFTVLNNGYSPTFPLFDGTGHVVARHLDTTFMGPTNLFPGSTTPAKAGETITLVLYGLGAPSGTAPTAGSATQSGSLPSALQCWISGFRPGWRAALIVRTTADDSGEFPRRRRVEKTRSLAVIKATRRSLER